MISRRLPMQRTRKNGYVLMDVLVAILIATVLFVAITNGIITAAGIIMDSQVRILKAITERNEFEHEQRIETTPD